MRTLTGHEEWIRTVAFDSTCLLASGSGDQTIKLWHKNTGNLLRTLEDHDDRVWQLAFDSNNLLASCSRDKTIKLWST